eukprot:scaffold140_cov163-Amphora_coffeaeformis.AAC.9
MDQAIQGRHDRAIWQQDRFHDIGYKFSCILDGRPHHPRGSRLQAFHFSGYCFIAVVMYQHGE